MQKKKNHEIITVENKGTKKLKMPRANKEKNREYFKKWYQANKEKQYRRIKERQQKIRKWLGEYKKTLKCELCNESHVACLDFHHKDPNEKEASLSMIYMKGWSIERIKKEIDKCQVLCSNCHRKLHFELTDTTG